MTQQSNRQVKTWLRAAALSAALVVIGAADAQAQFRKENGNARDANNRVGSGGVNDGPVDNRVGASGNQIVTGNVTGGREFRGPVGYTDPREFRGTTGFERSDRFVRDSSGPRRTGPSIVQRPTAYYGSALAQPIDASFAPTAGATGGYVQTTVPQGPGVGFDGVQPGRSGAFAGPLGQPSSIGGGLDTSPLFGVRAAQPFQSPIDAFRTDPLFATSGDRLRADDAAIRQMRDELSQGAAGARPADAQQPGGATGANPPSGVDDAGRPGALGTPLDAPLRSDVAAPGSGLQNGSLDSSVPDAAIGGDVTTGQGTRSRLVVPPAEQSSQYKELVRRMQTRTGDTSGQEARDYNMLRRAQEQGKKPGQPGDPNQPGGAPGQPGAAPRTPAAPVRPSPRPNPGEALPPTPSEPTAGPAVPTEPMEVKSLAAGITSKGLADLLSDAERLMKEQKYESAVIRYDQAARVVPNNPMVTLGRGIAQLGGGNYGQAEQALCRSIGGEPALLMGRYDLNGMLGEERVKVLTKDLKEVAVTSPKEVRPRLLLAFLAYNTGNGPDADKYVGEALALTPNDPVLQSMQKTWSVLGNSDVTPPAPPAELNK